MPFASVPILLPSTTFPDVPAFWMRTPSTPLPETRLPAPPAVPPTVLFDADTSMSTPSEALPSLAVPLTSVPTLLPSTTFPVAPVFNWTPLAPLPDSRLPAPLDVPPTVLFDADTSTSTPSEALPSLAVPRTSVPILLPSTTLPDVPSPVTSTP